jgi:hypothetical protein
LRYHVRKIRIASTRQESIEDGKKYLPTLGDDGAWHLVTKGDSAQGCKRFAALSEEDLGGPVDSELAEFRTRDLTSSVDTDILMLRMNELSHQPVPSVEEQFADVRMDTVTGQVYDENDVPIQFTEESTRESSPVVEVSSHVPSGLPSDVPSGIPSAVPSDVPLPRPRRTTAGQTNRYRDVTNTVAIKAYHAFVVTLFWVGMIFLNDGLH